MATGDRFGVGRVPQQQRHVLLVGDDPQISLAMADHRRWGVSSNWASTLDDPKAFAAEREITRMEPVMPDAHPVDRRDIPGQVTGERIALGSTIERKPSSRPGRDPLETTIPVAPSAGISVKLAADSYRARRHSGLSILPVPGFMMKTRFCLGVWKQMTDRTIQGNCELALSVSSHTTREGFWNDSISRPGSMASSFRVEAAPVPGAEVGLDPPGDVDTWTMPHTAYTRYVKPLCDFTLALVLLGVLLLPMICIAIAIRLDSPGNPLFLQRRVGRNGREFTIWKFRTMQRQEGTELELIEDENGHLRHKVRNDPRVTRVGRILRKTSLDELPQLLNIIGGHIGLVGPRPELPEIVAQYEPWQHRRHLVRPGLTGLWQVSGRSDKPMHEHTQLDIEYIERVSLRLDVVIMVKTVKVVARGLGAF